METTSQFPATMLAPTITDLFRLSESRGKEAAGLAILTDERISVYKAAISASGLIRSAAYRRLFRNEHGENEAVASRASAVIGHSRLVTNGAQELNENNQPVIASDTVAVHNGIICNDGALWARFPQLTRTAEIDTEVLLRLLEHHFHACASLETAVRETFQLIQGTASIAVLLKDRDAVLLATNNGSLYTCSSRTGDAVVFASERYILDQLTSRTRFQGTFDPADIVHCEPNSAVLIHTRELRMDAFALNGASGAAVKEAQRVRAREITQIGINGAAPPASRNGAPTVASSRPVYRSVQALLDEGLARIPELRRCTRCILPETMPFITFDAGGVCNYCHGYRPQKLHGRDALEDAVKPHRRTDGRPDCVLALSGGRDSTYSLHYVKNVLGLNPVAYTYDWGMVTDLARRNQARICGKLGVEHILVSADIARKREYIRKNVTAWMRRPDLGTVPLFMAGDKQFFYYANRLRAHMAVDLVVFSMNPLERTDFKTGFCGVSRTGTKDCYYGLPRWSKARLAGYYAKQFLINPAYINSSLADTIGAYWSYYFIPHDYLQFFHYVAWDEQTIEKTLIEEYDWELAPDTKSTWRIGDGTAPFYNYIYYIGAGFTENDTFRSNQIREGVIDRQTALDMVLADNRPRIESFKWYCDTIGLDCERAIRTINAMPKRYVSD
jgi:asparagine synthetase B (glutamine-hydrolysing)